MPVSLDCLILGGGIAGLWTLRTLLAEGYDAALVETNALGSGQTIASQGILHAGTKYALSGQAAEASRAAGEAAAIWRVCLRGRAAPGHAAALPDLSAASVLSHHTHMFTTSGVASRLTGLAASKALAAGPHRLPRSKHPIGLTEAPAGVDVYQLDEPVLDTRSLLDTLTAPARNRLIHADQVRLSWDRLPTGASLSPQRTVTVHVASDAGELDLNPRVLICTAGAGNEQLLAQLDLDADIAMQRRPLHMVLARFPETGEDSRQLPSLFTHCVTLSDKPRATITSAPDASGRTVWNIGGQLAESGVERSREKQIAATKRELSKILPWIDLAGAEFATHRIDRAEGVSTAGRRPDTPVVSRGETVIACWPTKLVLAPLAAAEILAHLKTLNISPTLASSAAHAGSDLPIANLPFATSPPPTATPPWDSEDLLWT